MARNIFDFGLKPVKIGRFGIQSPKSIKRTLGIRDKQILYQRAKGKCEACGKKIEFSEMQTGHKTAASKGGSTTFRNSVCLCYKCNKLQGTDSWATFMKKFRQVQISRYGGPEVLKTIESPEPIPQKNEVRIHVQAIGINFADILCFILSVKDKGENVFEWLYPYFFCTAFVASCCTFFRIGLVALFTSEKC